MPASTGQDWLTPKRKALLWGVSAMILGEGVPVGLLYAIAFVNSKPVFPLLQNLIGYAGLIVIAYGILVAALIDIILDEKTVRNVKRHCVDIVIALPILWLALKAQCLQGLAADTDTMIASGAVATLAFFGAGLAKRDSWERQAKVEKFRRNLLANSSIPGSE